MPKTNGQKLLFSIRDYESGKNVMLGHGVKIFMTTSQTDSTNVMTAFNEMCDGYIIKPILVVNGLKTYAQKREVNKQHVSLNSITSEALNLCHKRLKYNVTVHNNLQVLPEIFVDYQQLEQVFVNLILNSVDAMENKKKLISIS